MEGGGTVKKIIETIAMELSFVNVKSIVAGVSLGMTAVMAAAIMFCR